MVVPSVDFLNSFDVLIKEHLGKLTIRRDHRKSSAIRIGFTWPRGLKSFAIPKSWAISLVPIQILDHSMANVPLALDRPLRTLCVGNHAHQSLRTFGFLRDAYQATPKQVLSGATQSVVDVPSFLVPGLRPDVLPFVPITLLLLQ